MHRTCKDNSVKPNRRNEKKNIYIYIYIYIWDYGGHQLRLKCAQVRHHSPAGTFARVPGRCLGTPVTPCKIRSFTSIQMVHTHTFTHTEAFTHRSFYRQTLSHTETGLVKSQFGRSFWRSNLISRERVRRTLCKSQFYLSFWRSDFISCERVALGPEKAQFYRSFGLFGDRTSFRAKGLRPDPRKRNFTAVLGFLAIGLHFVRKGCARTRESAILPQFWAFWRSNFVSCERVAFRAVSLALPRAFKREIEKKERARGQESKRARENVKM